jgi:hypothetical protein
MTDDQQRLFDGPKNRHDRRKEAMEEAKRQRGIQRAIDKNELVPLAPEGKKAFEQLLHDPSATDSEKLMAEIILRVGKCMASTVSGSPIEDLYNDLIATNGGDIAAALKAVQTEDNALQELRYPLRADARDKLEKNLAYFDKVMAELKNPPPREPRRPQKEYGGKCRLPDLKKFVAKHGGDISSISIKAWDQFNREIENWKTCIGVNDNWQDPNWRRWFVEKTLAIWGERKNHA